MKRDILLACKSTSEKTQNNFSVLWNKSRLERFLIQQNLYFSNKTLYNFS